MAASNSKLTTIIDRVERLMEERKGITDDINVVFAEAKVLGYKTKVLREVIRLRAMSRDDLAERNALLAEYGAELGFDLL